ncbi:hypothetical protein PPK15_gp58 [Bacillus phage 000TH010]|uniref:Lipoprotein n=1 Tax=Bacillus phage 000TH010 TaxID=2601652 RepID=A0A5P8PHU4_9CAUD|nr:hypothetical protein PPK15_gp58 [Bacillus phage 000TH010]QFR56271.1 hypothetical protein 000TH010_58 [Bacillus phage 000TH010]
MKKIILGIAGVFTAVALTGCSESTMIYKGKERPVSEVEEMISDQLEVDNPDMDLDVSITEETD